MRLGIDLGTTRTIVAVEDRGNYPVVGFYTDEGDLIEHYPTTTSVVDGALVHGTAAEAAAQAGAPTLRSWKRLLAKLGPTDLLTLGDIQVSTLELVTSFLRSLRDDLMHRSNQATRFQSDQKAGRRTGPLSAVVSVPANAHSTQRFVTLEAFRAAGFEVAAVLNEPSAAGIEYAHRHKNTVTSRRENVVVYDLGGGTFDAALVRIADGHHDVITTSGVTQLGGDDFDQVLLDLALEQAGHEGDLDDQVHQALLQEVRSVKESLNPNSRKIALELAELPGRANAQPVVLKVSDYYERARPLVEQSLSALEPVLERAADSDQSGEAHDAGVAGIYMVGGASGLPVVPRIVRERFGRRVHRSPHPAAATAIGLAITAASQDGASMVHETFTRHFGVFRESDAGEQVRFDGIFEKGTAMPQGGDSPLVSTRRYRAAHNIGHFRFVESGMIDEAGNPTGDITPHGNVRFAFDAGLSSPTSLESTAITRLSVEGPWVEERYEVDAAGVIAVTITDLDDGRASRFLL